MIALIPARGGSKGLAKKNIKPLAGIPLIAHTIQAAINCPEISRVIVTTDSPAIAEVAKNYNAEIPFLRPAELASDTSRAIDTYLHAVAYLEEVENTSIEEICVLLPTAPLRKSNHISEAIRLFKEKEADSVISFRPEDHPYSWHKLVEDDGALVDIFEPNIENRQANRLSYYPNGAIYIFKLDLLKTGHYYSPKSYAYVMDKLNSVDIDDELDFAWAEFLMRRYEK